MLPKRCHRGNGHGGSSVSTVVVADCFGAGATTTVVAIAVPASEFIAGGGYAPRIHAVFGTNADQPLPTAVAVPYGTTESELAPV